MKKPLLLILLTILCTLSFQVMGLENESKEKIAGYDVYFGNHLENKIVATGDMYIILHNPTELALTVMDKGAKEFCVKRYGIKFSATYVKLLGKYTAYFSCEITNKIDNYNLPNIEKNCILNRRYKQDNCDKFNEKNYKIIKEIESQIEKEVYNKSFDFIYAVRLKFYDEIIKFENIAEDKSKNKIVNLKFKDTINELSNPLNDKLIQLRREKNIQNEINNLSNPLNDKLIQLRREKNIQKEIDKLSNPLNDKLIQLRIEKNIQICKKYQFKEGSQMFNECILKLISNQMVTF